MKRACICIGLLATLLLMACTGKQKGNENTTDSTTVQTANTTVQSDISTFNLQGPVVSFTEEEFDGLEDGTFDAETGYGAKKVSFDANGQLILDERLFIQKEWELNREESGRIASIGGMGEMIEDIPSYEYYYNFYYDSKGRLERQEEEYIGELHGYNKNTYHYDESNHLTGWTFNNYGDGMDVNGETTIKPIDIDEHGNWTRAVFSTITTTEGEGVEPYTDENVHVVIRKFQYAK